MTKLHKNIIATWQIRPWIWCLHCEKAQWHEPDAELTSEWEEYTQLSEYFNVLPHVRHCRYCGAYIMDLMFYDELRLQYPDIKKRWPIIPIEGYIYPLYDILKKNNGD